MSGFKANLSSVCGCPIQIVGRTKDQLSKNLERHAKDVHKAISVSADTTQKLKLATRKIQG
ncbi:MAG: DUF1059 domain-containing protein [Nitrososphaerales archaeon]